MLLRHLTLALAVVSVISAPTFEDNVLQEQDLVQSSEPAFSFEEEYLTALRSTTGSASGSSSAQASGSGDDTADSIADKIADAVYARLGSGYADYVAEFGDSGSGYGTCDDYTCDDGSDWHDSDGTYFDCNWYSEGDNCDDYGDGYEMDGYDAQQACCACGGGTTGVNNYIEEESLGSGDTDEVLVERMVKSKSVALLTAAKSGRVVSEGREESR